MAATHKGHCQLCGRLQMLGLRGAEGQHGTARLSLHGYTVRHGFFSGTCRGARHLPFEQSCDLVKDAIERAQKALVETEEQIARLLVLPEEPLAMVRHFFKAGGPRVSGHRWVQVAIERHNDRFSYLVEGKRVEFPYYHFTDLKTPHEVALKLNTTYAKWRQHEVTSLNDYIKWQQDRVATWQPADLLPVTHADKAGFKPTEAPY